ncbi:LuxR family transcriptional regulator [Gordonia sp. HNM0687]|uniref:LuxR family transcriptional regulator n=1 Tax=Gordonia mangrovi TaxID=2665643 RepID=A0A6L7GN72_9ACTN|nr:helix-turn-helix transcriptional regulator [Gordonia mangrovi]MXP20641.1 LuxR family transcriptional regulator [Gordonia mangrovi]UVF78779.1 helix-turn-helix transcriptional regulator [Gordonia mangrovi]
MTTSLTLERVRSDVDVLARAGLDVGDFLGEAISSLVRAVPHAAACMATVDPNTLLLTSTRKYGNLLGRNDHDDEWGLREYGAPECSSFRQLARAGIDAVGMHEMTAGKTQDSPRMHEFMRPNYDFTDEARLILRDGDQVWGAIAFFREFEEKPFTSGEVDFLRTLSQPLARGVRTGLLATIVAEPQAVPSGPCVLIVDSHNQMIQMSAGAEERLADLLSGANSGAATSVITGLVSAARRYGRGESEVPPRLRVRGASGMWLVVHASPLSSTVDRVGEVVVTIEEARPPEIVPLVVAAFGLTSRERDVTQMVLQGVATKDIAATLHVSAYTVQDHLKSIFDKAGVRSRRELIARVYFDQYAPRMNDPLLPSGSYATSPSGLM